IKSKRVTIHDVDALVDLIASDANPRKRGRDAFSAETSVFDSNDFPVSDFGETSEFNNGSNFDKTFAGEVDKECKMQS
ncbi:MAG TPA: hypothetical protein PKA48_14120, partial [Candidatus Obscuribacter sp.]|nr:hypothetical protein [Candidatus Obscuribacter sp.]